MNNFNNQTSSRNRGRWILLFLVALFVIPMVAAWSLYTHQPSWLTAKTINSGYLVQPPLDFTQFKFHHLDGSAFNPADLNRKWLMVYIAPEPCDNTCQHNLYNIRQVWIALGKDEDRMQRLLITYPYLSQVKANLIPRFNREFPGMYYAKTSLPEIQRFFTKNLPNTIAPQQGALYLVDPHSNLMMAYPVNFVPKGLLKDLTRLLNTSEIG